MKKIVITLVVLGFALGAIAQQIPFDLRVQPFPGTLLKQQLLKTDSLNRNGFLFKKADSLGANPLKRINIISNRNADNMPIANLPGKSKMPIVQTDRTGYNMPVVGMRQPQVYTMKKPGANTEVLPVDNKENNK